MDGLRTHAAAAYGGRTAAGCELDRRRPAEPLREAEREPRREAVTRAVRVHEWAGQRRRPIRPARLHPASERARGRDDKRRRRVEAAQPVSLSLVLPAPDKRVKRDAPAFERLQLARGRDERACLPCSAQRVHVTRGEVDRIHTGELVPGIPIVVAARKQLLAERRNRPLAALLNVNEHLKRPPRIRRRVDVHAVRLKFAARGAPVAVVPEHGEEMHLVREERELDCCCATASTRLLPLIDGLHDLAPPRHALDARETGPLDVPDHRRPHCPSVPHLTAGGCAAFQRMMGAVAIPPFETFYAAHAPEVLRFLRGRVGADRADDLFQETFLRALAAYGRLRHGEHMRAWVFTIASRVVIDAHRRRDGSTGEMPELAHEDADPVLVALAPLTDGLPRAERAAVILRYGFDLDYDRIAAALGSSPMAARQAASAGVRRLRRERSLG